MLASLPWSTPEHHFGIGSKQPDTPDGQPIHSRQWERRLLPPVIEIREVDALSNSQVEDLCTILAAVIKNGASVGWVNPPDKGTLADYWRGVIRTDNRLVCAFEGDQIIATGQLELAQKENGQHRAEIGKVL